MATSYSQDPNSQKAPNADGGGGATLENRQKAQETAAKNNAARRALPWIVVGAVEIALIVFVATRGQHSNNANGGGAGGGD